MFIMHWLFMYSLGSTTIKNKQTNKQTKEKKKRKKEKKEKKERKKDIMLEFVISEKKPSVNVDYVKLCHAMVAILDFFMYNTEHLLCRHSLKIHSRQVLEIPHLNTFNSQYSMSSFASPICIMYHIPTKCTYLQPYFALMCIKPLLNKV